MPPKRKADGNDAEEARKRLRESGDWDGQLRIVANTYVRRLVRRTERRYHINDIFPLPDLLSIDHMDVMESLVEAMELLEQLHDRARVRTAAHRRVLQNRGEAVFRQLNMNSVIAYRDGDRASLNWTIEAATDEIIRQINRLDQIADEHRARVAPPSDSSSTSSSTSSSKSSSDSGSGVGDPGDPDPPAPGGGAPGGAAPPAPPGGVIPPAVPGGPPPPPAAPPGGAAPPVAPGGGAVPPGGAPGGAPGGDVRPGGGITFPWPIAIPVPPAAPPRGVVPPAVPEGPPPAIPEGPPPATPPGGDIPPEGGIAPPWPRVVPAPPPGPTAPPGPVALPGDVNPPPLTAHPGPTAPPGASPPGPIAPPGDVNPPPLTAHPGPTAPPGASPPGPIAPPGAVNPPPPTTPPPPAPPTSPPGAPRAPRVRAPRPRSDSTIRRSPDPVALPPPGSPPGSSSDSSSDSSGSSGSSSHPSRGKVARVVPGRPPVRLNGFHRIPVELALMIVNRLGIHEQLRLLAAYPTAFRDGRINILAIQAARERVLVNSGPPGPPGPGDNNDDVEPMLSSAIRGQIGQPNHPLHIIAQILDAYDEALGKANSVDAIYLNRTHTPALFLAITSGRADVVRLLLDRGASIDIAQNPGICEFGEYAHLYTMCRDGTRCGSAVALALHSRRSSGRVEDDRDIWEYDPRSHPYGYDGIQEALILLCIAQFRVHTTRVVLTILDMFSVGDNHNDVIREAIQRIEALPETDPARVNLGRAYQDIIQAVAEHPMSRCPRQTDRIGEVTAYGHGLDLISRLSRSDDLLAHLIWCNLARPARPLRPQQLIEIANDEERWRVATVILSHFYRIRDGMGGISFRDTQHFITEYVELVMAQHSDGTIDWRNLDFIRYRLVDFLLSADYAHIVIGRPVIVRIIYAALEIGLVDYAKDIMNHSGVLLPLTF